MSTELDWIVGSHRSYLLSNNEQRDCDNHRASIFIAPTGVVVIKVWRASSIDFVETLRCFSMNIMLLREYWFDIQRPWKMVQQSDSQSTSAQTVCQHAYRSIGQFTNPILHWTYPSHRVSTLLIVRRDQNGQVVREGYLTHVLVVEHSVCCVREHQSNNTGCFGHLQLAIKQSMAAVSVEHELEGCPGLLLEYCGAWSAAVVSWTLVSLSELSGKRTLSSPISAKLQVPHSVIQLLQSKLCSIWGNTLKKRPTVSFLDGCLVRTVN